MIRFRVESGAVIFLLCALASLDFHFSIASSASGDDQPTASRTVDELVYRSWVQNHLTPSGPCDDVAFLRRVSLDLVGVIPPADYTLEFLRSRDPEKRTRVVNDLITGELYVEYWANYWTNVLVGRVGGQGFNRGTLKQWLRSCLQKNEPYDQMVRELLTAAGNTEENGAANYLSHFQNDKANLAGNVSKTFMGVRIQCMQCHNHKTEPSWKQEDFWGFTAYFAKTQAQTIRPKDGERRDYWLVEDRPNGEVRMPAPRNDHPIPARFFIPVSGVTPAGTDRRQIAELITSSNNPYFAPALVNRMWAYFFGRGIVEPFNDFRDSNPPSNPELLRYLSKIFREHGYDLRYLMTVIVNTQAYQLSSIRATPGRKDPDDPYFTHAHMRLLSPEQLFYSILQATAGEDLMKMRRRQDIENLKVEYLSKFIRMFKTDEMQIDSDFGGTIPQALWMLNGDILNRSSSSKPGGGLDAILSMPAPERDRIQALYLRILSRYPSEAERRDILLDLEKLMSSTPAATWQPSATAEGKTSPTESPAVRAYREFYEDLTWALLNSSEFVLNH